jgi:hypothetical protein
MGRNKAKDDHYFDCTQESERLYVAGLYEDPKKVYNFLVLAYNSGIIRYCTHKQVYRIIKEKLDYEIPA